METQIITLKHDGTHISTNPGPPSNRTEAEVMDAVILMLTGRTIEDITKEILAGAL